MGKQCRWRAGGQRAPEDLGRNGQPSGPVGLWDPCRRWRGADLGVCRACGRFRELCTGAERLKEGRLPLFTFDKISLATGVEGR